MEIIELRPEAEVPRAHADMAGFGVRFPGIPPLDRDPVQGSHGTGAIGAAPAMKEDWIVRRVIDQLEVFSDGSFGNLRPGPDVFDRNVDVVHS